MEFAIKQGFYYEFGNNIGCYVPIPQYPNISKHQKSQNYHTIYNTILK